MTMTPTTRANRFHWRLPVSGFFGAILALLPMLIWGDDVLPIVASAIAFIIIGVILVVIFFRTVRFQSVAAIVMVAVFALGSWLLFQTSDDLRTTIRWAAQSGAYKSEVIAQPKATNGYLKHVQWDISGFVGTTTMTYLVFDPDDSLGREDARQSDGKERGLPCKVSTIRRLESRWYIVRFYTETNWSFCG